MSEHLQQQQTEPAGIRMIKYFNHSSRNQKPTGVAAAAPRLFSFGTFSRLEEVPASATRLGIFLPAVPATERHHVDSQRPAIV